MRIAQLKATSGAGLLKSRINWGEPEGPGGESEMSVAEEFLNARELFKGIRNIYR
jgi:hypothetical protein